MPGKQMAIDADLNAGLINEDEARRRREDDHPARPTSTGPWTVPASSSAATPSPASSSPSSTSSAGSYVGMVEHGMDAHASACELFTKLTIGDGLVSQIPAFIISHRPPACSSPAPAAKTQPAARRCSRQLTRQARSPWSSPAASWCMLVAHRAAASCRCSSLGGGCGGLAVHARPRDAEAAAARRRGRGKQPRPPKQPEKVETLPGRRPDGAGGRLRPDPAGRAASRAATCSTASA